MGYDARTLSQNAFIYLFIYCLVPEKKNITFRVDLYFLDIKINI